MDQQTTNIVCDVRLGNEISELSGIEESSARKILIEDCRSGNETEVVTICPRNIVFPISKDIIFIYMQ